MKRKIRFYIITLIILCVSMSISINFLENSEHEEVKCGVVTYKSEQLYSRYKSTSINVAQELYVKYDDGVELVKNVDTRTFETNKVGDRICFKETVSSEVVKEIICVVILVLSVFGIICYSIGLAEIIYEKFRVKNK